MTIILNDVRRWVCPNCPTESASRERNRWHACAGLKGLMAPMVLRGVRAQVMAVEREDYIGTDRVLLHDGRPIMAVVTERNDGEDRTVFAPTATGSHG